MIPKPKTVKNKKSKAWLKFRKDFLAGKQNFEGYYTCEICGKWIKYPEVDHIKKRSIRPNLVFDIDNLRILCHDCHIGINPDYSISSNNL